VQHAFFAQQTGKNMRWLNKKPARLLIHHIPSFDWLHAESKHRYSPVSVLLQKNIKAEEQKLPNPI
jgi:hypothetical protein